MVKGALTAKLIATVAIVALGSLQFGYHMAELNSPQAILSCALSVLETLSTRKRSLAHMVLRNALLYLVNKSAWSPLSSVLEALSGPSMWEP